MNPLKPIAIVALAVAGQAVNSASPTLGQFDFQFQISGDYRARPVQVFDKLAEGKTYFQFRRGEDIPVVFLADGKQWFVPRQEGGMWVVDSAARDFTLVMGMSQARVQHVTVVAGVVKSRSPAGTVLLASADGGLPDTLLAKAQTRQPSPESQGNWTAGSFAQPLRGDVITWRSEQQREAPVSFPVGGSKLSPATVKSLLSLGRSIGNGARVEVIGTDDESLLEKLPTERAEAIRSELVRAGVPPQNIVVGQPRPAGVVTGSGKSRVVESIVRWYPSAPMLPAAPLAAAEQARAPAAGLSPDTLRLLVSRGIISQEQAALAMNTGAGGQADKRGSREVTEWELRKADANVGTSLQRWARAAGFEVVWDTTIQAPIVADSVVVAGDFKLAIAKVFEGLQKAGYPLKARVFSDNVVRVYSPES